ncbi:glycoside hydrolase family 64 protein [Patellaria atrata CBS 101060]|uniref:Glycoside hydrolase family 64 protein n=1 Tax=Patellaria atrata CBS 101060 TaxID=1346257 RepID=A0A9P4S8R3_9PEZI|nr:glycoside hydrolase family 64 protein [Patellaria atrata CBS 101060]
MRSLLFLAALVGSVIARPLVIRADPEWTPVQPGGIDDIVITEENTLNGTFVNGTSHGINNPPKAARGAQLPLSFVNNFSGGAVKAYVTGLDVSGRVVFLSRNGNWIYPSARGSQVPIPVAEDVSIPLTGRGGTLNINLPDYISSSRIWFAEGDLKFFMVSSSWGETLVTPSHVNPQDPSAGVNWGFVELTNIAQGGLWANISYVDFVGLVLGMKLRVRDGSIQDVPGLAANSLRSICNDLSAQSNIDGRPWRKMCFANSNGVPIRALAPSNYHDIDPHGFDGYWQGYVDQVWNKCQYEALTINTQAAAGHVECRTSGDMLYCNGDNRGYSKPQPIDIWGCNAGPFAIAGGDNDVHRAVVPRLCAAFVRSTLLVEGGNVQPGLRSERYYTQSPTNHYSRIVHNYLTGGRGYAFPYDDVNPDGENAAGLVASPNPDRLTIYVGGP